MKIYSSVFLGIFFSFLMISCKKDQDKVTNVIPYVAPIISTTASTNVQPSSATVGGNITSDGGDLITQAGICYGTVTVPDTSNSVVSNHTISGPFTANLTNLIAQTTYYYRAYAINRKGISYGNVYSFITPFAFPASRLFYLGLDGSDSDVVSSISGIDANVSWVTGVTGKAAQLSGTNSYISYSNVNGFQNSTQFSVTFWFNSASIITGPFFSLNQSGFSWENSKMIFESEGSSTSTRMDAKLETLDVSWSVFTGTTGFTNVFDGKWHQIGLTYDGTKVSAYLDGALQNTVNTTIPLPFGAFDTFTIGSGGWFGTTTISACKIDQVGLYNAALSASDIVSLYNAKL